MIATVVKSHISARSINIGYKLYGACKIASRFVDIKELARNKILEELKKQKTQDKINEQLSEAINKKKELQLLVGDCAGSKTASTVRAERALLDKKQKEELNEQG